MEEENRIITTNEIAEDEHEYSLRPKALSEYIGQQKAKENLKIFIEAAKQRGESWIMFCFMALPDWVRPPWRG